MQVEQKGGHGVPTLRGRPVSQAALTPIGIYDNFARMSSAINRIAKALTVLWVAPVSVFALLLLPLAVWRASWRITGGVLEITSPALSWFLQGPWFRAMSGGAGFAAATIGHVLVARNRASMDNCRVHEHVHVRQCERWGALMPLAYVSAGLYAAWRARRWSAYYWDNWFEREARAAEGGAPGGDKRRF